MPARLLVAYSTNAGSTSEIAEAVARELRQGEVEVDVRNVRDVSAGDMAGYAGVVVGGPMMLGWHREALGFVRTHREALSRLPVAYFFSALSLTKTGGTAANVPTFVDPRLAKAPKTAGRLSLRERYATVANYLQPALDRAPQVKPVSVAFFGGRLDFGRLKWWQLLFVMLIIGAQPGDYRNWSAIRDWATGLRPQLLAA